MKSETKNYSRRQMRFAEAGVLFLLILGLTVFGGVKLATKGGEPASDAAVAALEPTPDTVVSTAPETEVIATPARDDSTAGNEIMQTVATAPAPRVITYAMAEAAFFEAHYDEAGSLFGEYTADHPQNAWGHYMEGLSLWRAGDPESAEEALRCALELQPEHLKSLVNLGRVLIEVGRAREALPLLENAVALDADNSDAYRVLGRVYHNLNRRDEAIDAYRQALLRNDEDSWSLNNLGLIFIENESFDEALPPLARATALNGNVACFQNNLGIALERSGHSRQAAEAFAAALAVDATCERARISLARIDDCGIPAGEEDIDLVACASEFVIQNDTVTDLTTVASSTPVTTELH